MLWGALSRVGMAISGGGVTEPRAIPPSPAPSGIQKQTVYCMERHYGTMDNRYCEFLGPPEEHQRICTREPCPAK